jgi:hypothetical protein
MHTDQQIIQHPVSNAFLAKSHHLLRCSLPIEIRPHFRTALAAALAHEMRLNVRQPDIIRPLIGIDCD